MTLSYHPVCMTESCRVELQITLNAYATTDISRCICWYVFYNSGKVEGGLHILCFELNLFELFNSENRIFWTHPRLKSRNIPRCVAVHVRRGGVIYQRENKALGPWYVLRVHQRLQGIRGNNNQLFSVLQSQMPPPASRQPTWCFCK